MLELLFNSVSVASLICEWENSACSRKRDVYVVISFMLVCSAATVMFELEFLFSQFILRFLF
ncbi:hypothetical protein [Bacillus subtilis]|uniref:hypothetical protein n=1 Tax=Bacillus subtilis TaxID=1423 RepID=UPI004059FD93